MRRWLAAAAAALTVALTVAAVLWYHDWQHWAAYAFGAYNCPKGGCPQGAPHNYNFFSGSGSDIGQITLVASIAALIATLLRKHNCEVHGCWRLGRHGTAAGHTVCRKHHPDDKLTHADVLAAHAAATAPAVELRMNSGPAMDDVARTINENMRRTGRENL